MTNGLKAVLTNCLVNWSRNVIGKTGLLRQRFEDNPEKMLGCMYSG